MVRRNGGIIEKTEKFAGGGLMLDQRKMKNEGLKNYTTWGAVSDFLSDELIQTISTNIGALTETYFYVRNLDNQNYEKDKDMSEFWGSLAQESSLIIFNFFKSFAEKKDKLLPIEGMIKIINYCRDNTPSFVADVTVQKLLLMLPLPLEKSRKIYYEQQIDTLDDIKKIRYSDEQCDAIGFLLYYLTRSQSCDISYNLRLKETLNVLGVYKNITDYEERYMDIAKKEAEQIFLVNSVVKQFDNPQQMGISPQYLAKVIEKLSCYIPNGYSHAKKVVELGSKGANAILDKDYVSAVNICGESIAIMMDTPKLSTDISDDDKLELIRRRLISVGVDSKAIDSGDDSIMAYADGNTAVARGKRINWKKSDDLKEGINRVATESAKMIQENERMYEEANREDRRKMNNKMKNYQESEGYYGGGEYMNVETGEINFSEDFKMNRFKRK